MPASNLEHVGDGSSSNPSTDLDEPMFSIITATYNCKPKLERTIKSVLSQSFKSFEYVLVDGASKDGSAEWLAGIEDPRVRTVSEPDKGVYDAMNKGIRLARGKYLYFLGAGDELLPGALEEMSNHLPEDDLVMIYGNVWWKGMVYDGEFTKLKLCGQNICHQAIFYARNVFQILGGFDLKYKTAADWVFNMSCFANNHIHIRHVPVTVAKFEEGGLSSHGDPAFDADRHLLTQRHFGKEISDISQERMALLEQNKTLLENYNALLESNKSLKITFHNLCSLVKLRLAKKMKKW